MPRLTSALTTPPRIALLLVLACTASPKSDGDTAAPAPIDTSGIPTSGDPLVFPPALARRDRRPLPARFGAVDDAAVPFAVETPQLDDKGRWELSGTSVYVRLNHSAKRDGKAPPAVTIDPPVAGKARWSSDWSLSFDAKEPFDPDQDYTIEIGPLEDAKGDSLTWKGTFRADPEIWVGGKLITYLPAAGKPRVVSTRPYDGAKVGRRPVMTVLFDQATDLKLAETLIDVTDDAGKPVPVKLRHPSKSLFDGNKVNRKFIVEVQPKRPLKPGTEAKFAVRDFGLSADRAEVLDLEVAKSLRFDKAECRYDSDACSTTGGRLHIGGREFAMRFNNVIEGKNLREALDVDPPVSNLSVWSDRWGSSGTVVVSGAFEPSTTYTVTLDAATDIYGSKLATPLTVELETSARTASVSMATGVQFLDARGSKSFNVTTRNVDGFKLSAWEVDETDAAWTTANSNVGRRERPSGAATLEMKFAPAAKLDQDVTTTVDLLSKLDPGKAYIIELERTSVAFGAPLPKHPSWSSASKPPLALLMVNDDRALVVHARASGDKTLVHVASVTDGSPVAGAKLFVDGAEAPIKTDANGFAALEVAGEDASKRLLRVQAGDARTLLPLGRRVQTERHLVPELASGESGNIGGPRGLLMTDRGVYRPGATVHFKGSMRTPSGADLKPLAKTEMRLKVVDPNGKTAFEETTTSDDMGSVWASFTTEEGSPIGRYQVLLQSLPDEETVATARVQVAEFEAPKFKVDVTTKAGTGSKPTVLASIAGRYLFGAAMEDADVSWVVRRKHAPMPTGPFTARGLDFRQGYGGGGWSRNGSAKLDAKGALEIAPVVELNASMGPQSFTVEAEVTDSSHRAIAGRSSVVLHPASSYAGVRLTDRWPDLNKPLPLELGVIDTEGNAIAGKTITAELVRIEWKRTRRPGPGGSTRVEWHEVESKAGKCSVKSAAAVVSCDLTPTKNGTYQVRTKLDGVAGGTAHFWAWGSGWAGGEPQPGHRLELVSDAKTYKPGDTAKIIAQNPFEHATALFTVEQGAVLHSESRDVAGGPIEFEVPIKGEHAPHVHASVTFLPKQTTAEQLVQWKFGALRLPVALDGVALDVEVSSDVDHYEPRGHATIAVAVKHAGKPVEGAEVALAVVDEGVLRLTNYRAPNPVSLLRPGVAFRFGIADTRTELAELLERSHIAGDGSEGGAQASLVETRKNFVRTALWRPNLRTSADGTVEVELELPDNLTEFRMMAVVLDDTGRGGKAKSSFEVRKPLMIQPAVPRFALRGDRFEAAVMVHSGLTEATEASVTLGGDTQKVSLPARGRKRVAFERIAAADGDETLVFEVKDSTGKVRDRVEAVVPLQTPGIDDSPRLASAFTGAQEVLMEIPEGTYTDLSKDAMVTITLGHQAWPELGSRLEYLVDYPHGCVEQTTSSTLPLLAARDVLPRLGFFRYSKEEIDAMALAGIKRLATMKTSSGGLAYWPGGYDANLYGTAYAMRAVALAKAQGIEVPGLLDGMAEYLQSRLEDDDGNSLREVEVKASIALALAEAGKLPESSADMLVDTLPHQGVFGAASIALALSSLDGHSEQVDKALKVVLEGLDEHGKPTKKNNDEDFHYFGSSSRTQAQAALALIRLQPTSTLIPQLIESLVDHTGSYTTQATAFGLLAIREKVVSSEGEDAQLTVRLDGEALVPDAETTAKMGAGAARYEVPLSELSGRHGVLRLESSGKTAVSFQVEAKYRRPFAGVQSLVATSAENGPEVYRVFTTAKGEDIDLSAVAPGTVVRVAVLARLPESLSHERRGYLAVTDRLPAGFEPIMPDLWTVSRPAELTDKHPLYAMLQWGSVDASHIEMRDDRVHMYFDRIWGEYVAGTYTMRATTPGTYVVPPAMAELMYEPDSLGYSKHESIVVTK